MKRLIPILLVLFLLFQSPGLRAETAGSLTVGDRGQAVLELKQRLRDLRYITKGPLTRAFTEKTAEALREFQRLNGLPETGEADETTRAVLFSEAAAPKPHPTLVPLATPAPLPVPDWPERDTRGFLKDSGEYVYENDEAGLWIYLSDRLQIVITFHEDSSIPLQWFETEIRTGEETGFFSVLTDPEHPGKRYRYPYEIAREANAVLAFSDDFFATRMSGGETVGIIIRDGRVISRETNRKTGHHLPNLDMMAQYPDGRLAVYACNEYSAEELVEMGAVNVFSFGPWLLRDGEINELLYQYYRSTEPRQALGMIEPFHYLLVSVQGRTRDSKGTMLQRVAEMMKERGVTQALNFDGGNTMALIFRGRMLNRLATYKNRKFVRTVTSVIAIGQTDRQADD